MCCRLLSKFPYLFLVYVNGFVLMGDSCWHQFNAQHVESRPLRMDDQGDDKEVQVQVDGV